MTKQYYCEMDKSVFSTEEELINHIKNRYVKVFEGKDHEPSDLLTSLQNEFPEYEINIKEGTGWYTQYIITLTKGDSTINQYYGNDKRRSEYNHDKPSTYNEMVKEIKAKISTYKNVVKRVSELYNFAEFYFAGYEYGYSEDEHSYRFVFKVHENDVWDSEDFHPYEMEINEFINDLNKYFVKVLEGEPNAFHDDGYFSDYTIDGVKIGMMMSNKRVRLEVIE